MEEDCVRRVEVVVSEGGMGSKRIVTSKEDE